jgi:hypothetical protein
VKPLGIDAAREIGTFTLKTKGQQPQEVAGKYVVVWDEGRRRLEAGDRHLEYRQMAWTAEESPFVRFGAGH